MHYVPEEENPVKKKRIGKKKVAVIIALAIIAILAILIVLNYYSNLSKAKREFRQDVMETLEKAVEPVSYYDVSDEYVSTMEKAVADFNIHSDMKKSNYWKIYSMDNKNYLIMNESAWYFTHGKLLLQLGDTFKKIEDGIEVDEELFGYYATEEQGAVFDYTVIDLLRLAEGMEIDKVQRGEVTIVRIHITNLYAGKSAPT